LTLEARPGGELSSHPPDHEAIYTADCEWLAAAPVACVSARILQRVWLCCRDGLNWEDAGWSAMGAGRLLPFRVGARRCPMGWLTGELKRREAAAP
jgi:hypothetical protein